MKSVRQSAVNASNEEKKENEEEKEEVQEEVEDDGREGNDRLRNNPLRALGTPNVGRGRQGTPNDE